MDYHVIIALAGCACVLLGAASRRWWIIAVALIPSVLWLWVSLPGWSEASSDGATGADWFVGGILYVGAPVAALVAAGVCLGRWLSAR